MISRKLSMPNNQTLSAIINQEGNGYVSLYPELDIASQGDTIEESLANLTEAVELFYEEASVPEIKERTHFNNPR